VTPTFILGAKIAMEDTPAQIRANEMLAVVGENFALNLAITRTAELTVVRKR
jgi:hypothetical protein